MKKITFLKYKSTGIGTAMCALVAAGLLVLGGCTKNFENINTDNSGITNAELLPDQNSVGLYYPGMFQNIFGEEGDYQLMQNLNSDSYSGYYMSPDPFQGNINNQSYALVDGWNSDVYSVNYTRIMGVVQTIAKKGTRTSSPDFWAIAKIIQVTAMSRVTDYYGPIPYSKVGQGSTTPYDSQQQVYNELFADLDTAVTNLEAFEVKNNPNYLTAGTDAVVPFAKFDMVYGGSYLKWLKYANSLRLRLAMHIVNIDPTTAKAQALKAINEASGLITLNTQNANISGYGYHSPIWWIGTSWTDLAVGADLTSYLNGYKDPREAGMISPATAPSSIAGQYVGIREGTPVSAKPGYTGYSLPNFTTISEYTPMNLMVASEVWFLRAEAALRGWTTESAQTDYETGINTSMSQWNTSAGSYLTDNTSTEANYIDPQTPATNVPNASITAPSTITVAWNAAATNEQNLERIITQKWIAMFPCGGWEAWTEYRRTGYPRLFPVVVNNSGGTISTSAHIRRIAYPSSEYTNNTAAVQAAVTLLGGADNGGTSVWWDTNKGQAVPKNF